MREKSFYIEEISNILLHFDIGTVLAVYNALGKLKGEKNGLKKENHRKN